ncbi:MFS transporter [Pelagicoccus mobilis]|uniref:MFS transporter n=1 Tax=Pelagicoccus mobilis TaxID=415221 RepID=A0A934S6B5_9BACT|nr:MFS transporter [Pelagicoccus mobilis]MBK1879738.1 MFS transporter [Pelagicoccus mobilis]
MIITRKTKVPLHWTFYAQLPLLLSIYGAFVINAPFLLLIKKFIDNPAAIMGLISIEIYISIMGTPFISWLSDHIWTRWGRRKFFFVIADVGRALCLIAMPFAPNLWSLIILRWLFGAAGDFAGMTQALIYEVVPPPQRGRLSGFFQGSIQFGNILFFFLLLGRFDDYYFMGPFAQVTALNGGAIMFWLAAILLFGIAAYEGLGFKEIKPPDAKNLNSGRKPGQSIFVHFFKNFFKDVLSKDLLPVYLVTLIVAMFNVQLGVFLPLLYTEQWGYSLQEMGNTLAIGAVFAISFALLSGWFADRYGKMMTFVLANVGSLGMNVFYFIWVYNQPDFRPTLVQIVVIGNVTAIFLMIKGVVGFPLMMEYVERSRMGAANAGIQISQSIFRNGLLFFVGVWLAWWSYWFLPQAGYNVSLTFPEEKSEEQLVSQLQSAGVNPEELVLRPEHQFGVDGETSMRWWIHQNDKEAQELLEEKKKLKNELGSLETKADSPFLEATEAEEIQSQIAARETRITEIDQKLEAGVDSLKAKLMPALEQSLYEAGSQIRSASFSNETLSLGLTTIEEFDESLTERLITNISGPQFALVRNQNENAATRWSPDVSIESIQGQTPGVNIDLSFDPIFLDLYEGFYRKTESNEKSFEASSAIISLVRALIGRGPNRFELSVDQSNEDASSISIELTLLERALIDDLELIAEGISEEKLISDVALASTSPSEHQLTLTLEQSDKDIGELQPRAIEASERIDELLGQRGSLNPLIVESYIRVSDTLAASPFYVTIPENTTKSAYSEREYEYFFSSKTLEIATDIIGFFIIIFLLIMEKRGVIHRFGAEEDENR